nr:toprim domain-containing protein [Lachnospiraceae bacterium]
AIDLMSYMDIHMDFETNKLALGMLSDAPLETFLEEHPQITSIRFCLDNDVPGRKATEELTEKYYSLGYDVEDCPPPKNYKDYNEWLVAVKLQPVRTERSMMR